MEKDHRYEVVKAMIERGKIVEFSQIFTYIPKKVLVDDLHSSFRRLTLLSGSHIDKLELGEIFTISKLIEVDMSVVYKLCEKQFLSRKTGASRKRKSKPVNQ
jgi:hypothetical protein